jgi:predicted  nucleic acid-binding Zn-ribbon protein
MIRKDMESERTLNATKVSALNDLVEGMQKQISDLQTQLSAARQDAKEIASSALESASGRRVSEALQRVVETRDPSKRFEVISKRSFPS